MNCKECGEKLNLIPAGISKKTGNPYEAFYSCPNRHNQNYKPELGSTATNPAIEAKKDEIRATLSVTSDEKRQWQIMRQHSQHMALLDFQIRAIIFDDEMLLERIEFYQKDLEKK